MTREEYEEVIRVAERVIGHAKSTIRQSQHEIRIAQKSLCTSLESEVVPVGRSEPRSGSFDTTPSVVSPELPGAVSGFAPEGVCPWCDANRRKAKARLTKFRETISARGTIKYGE